MDVGLEKPWTMSPDVTILSWNPTDLKDEWLETPSIFET